MYSIFTIYEDKKYYNKMNKLSSDLILYDNNKILNCYVSLTLSFDFIKLFDINIYNEFLIFNYKNKIFKFDIKYFRIIIPKNLRYLNIVIITNHSEQYGEQHVVILFKTNNNRIIFISEIEKIKDIEYIDIYF